ncbi:MAG: hypothetical protein AAGH76_07400 [Pseudomonadota bacterium]
MTASTLQQAFDALTRYRLPPRPPTADSGWLASADGRQRLRLLGFETAEQGWLDVYFRATGEPLLLVLAESLCVILTEKALPWPPAAELAMPIDVRTAQGGLLLLLEDAVAALGAAAADH